MLVPLRKIVLPMKNRIFKAVTSAVCIALCQSAVGRNEGNGGPAFASSEHPAPAKVEAALEWGEHTMSRTIETQTMFIRHKATEFQRRTAERNAQAFFAQLTPAKKVELRKKHVRTVLIPTARSPQTSPKAKEVRMRYSLEGESLIDDYAYEFQAPLQAGTVATLKGLDPEYVGL